MIGVMVPSVYALTTMPDDGKPDGHIPVLDDKIVIVDHNGLSYFCLLYTSPSPRD